jgi:hypothetical protein
MLVVFPLNYNSAGIQEYIGLIHCQLSRASMGLAHGSYSENIFGTVNTTLDFVQIKTQWYSLTASFSRQLLLRHQRKTEAFSASSILR